MAKFSVGEMAIIDNCKSYPSFIGMECEILSNPYDGIGSITGELCIGYDACLQNGEKHSIAERCLRKKKPPQELTTWEEVQKLTNWNPTKVEEHA